MKEYRVLWMKRHSFVSQVVFVEAGSVEDARAIARDHIERTMGIAGFTISSINESKPAPRGKVKE